MDHLRFIGARDFRWRSGALRLDRAGLLERAGILAERFARLRPGARIGILCDTPLDTGVATVAARLAGRTLALLDGSPAVLAAARPELLVIPPGRVIPRQWRGPVLRFDEDLRPRAEDGIDPHPASPDAPACDLLVFTSGSTGSPKAIGHRWTSIDRNSEELSGRLGLTEGDRFAALLPVFHLYGFLFNTAMPLWLGADVETAAGSDFLPGELSASGCTVLAGARPHISAINRTGGAPPSGLRCVVSSGGPLAEGDSEAFRARWGVPVRNIYGSSECLMISVNDPVRGEPDRTLGTPLPSSRLRVSDDGELQVLSEKFAARCEMGGVSGPLPLTADGWYATGDLVTGSAGDLRITGRLATTINVAGKKVSPESVEAALRRVPGVVDAGVAGYPDPLTVERVGAVLVSGGAPVDVLALRAALAGMLAPHELPRRVVWRRALPLLPNGKLDRRSLAEMLLAETRGG